MDCRCELEMGKKERNDVKPRMEPKRKKNIKTDTVPPRFAVPYPYTS